MDVFLNILFPQHMGGKESHDCSESLKLDSATVRNFVKLPQTMLTSELPTTLFPVWPLQNSLYNTFNVMTSTC